MPTKLKNMRIKRVALVDEGANPEAYVRFVKSKDPPEEPPAENEQGIIKRALAVLAKALGIELEKSAHTFAEAEETRNYDVVMEKEIYPMNWAMMDSVRSILMDTVIDDTTKETMLKQTLAEYSEAYTSAVPRWAKAELANETVGKEKSADVDSALVKVRDHLNELIEKGSCGDNSSKKPVKKDEDPDKDDDQDDEDGNEPPVKKGAIDMIFDTTKMSPEELATYEDLAKRYGSEETTHAPAAPAGPEPTAGDDVNKGINPVVAAELESLRKFREDFETKQYIEVAKKYTLLGKKPEELGPVLKGLKDAGGSAYDDMIGVLDSSLALVEKSGAFGEIGKRGHSAVDDAWGKIEAAAQEIIKSKPDMRYSDAIDAACIQHPELVEEYEKSRH